jgi:hypothetical protein
MLRIKSKTAVTITVKIRTRIVEITPFREGVLLGITEKDRSFLDIKKMPSR